MKFRLVGGIKMLLILCMIVLMTVVAKGEGAASPTVVQMFSSPQYKESSTNISLVSGCVSLLGFNEYDKNLASIKLHHPDPCVKLYPTYDCTDVSMRIQTKVLLLLGNQGKDVSSLGWCNATECPPGFQFNTKPSSLRVQLDNKGSDFIIEVHPGECLKFPKMLETHVVSLALNSRADECIELYEKPECEGSSTQITLPSKSYGDFSVSSLSLCDYKCRFNTTIYRLVSPGQVEDKDAAEERGIAVWKILITLLISIIVAGCIGYFLIRTFCMSKVHRIVRFRIHSQFPEAEK